MLTIKARNGRHAAALRAVPDGVEVRFAPRSPDQVWRWGPREVIAAPWARVIEHVEKVLNEEAGQ